MWLPNQWDNVTLQTEKFRLRLAGSGAEAKAVIAFFSTSDTAETGLAIKVPNESKGEFEIITNEQGKGSWEELTSTGYVWKS